MEGRISAGYDEKLGLNVKIKMMSIRLSDCALHFKS